MSVTHRHTLGLSHVDHRRRRMQVAVESFPRKRWNRFSPLMIILLNRFLRG